LKKQPKVGQSQNLDAIRGELKKHIPLQGLNMLFGQKRLLRVIDTSNKYLRRSLIPIYT